MGSQGAGQESVTEHRSCIRSGPLGSDEHGNNIGRRKKKDYDFTDSQNFLVTAAFWDQSLIHFNNL